jgi:hypothetical protein
VPVIDPTYYVNPLIATKALVLDVLVRDVRCRHPALAAGSTHPHSIRTTHGGLFSKKIVNAYLKTQKFTAVARLTSHTCQQWREIQILSGKASRLDVAFFE